MTAWPPRERRLSFGPVAEAYEAARPSYPTALVGEVLEFAGAAAGAAAGDRIVEVGAGTGKATRLFAASGASIVALEPSPEMAAVCRRACAAHPAVRIVEVEFERWEPEPGAFRLLISAQAWHWVDPEARYRQARRALARDGALAVFWNRPDWRACALWPALDETYARAAPELPPAGPMHPRATAQDLVEDWRAEVATADGFDCPEVRGYGWTATYTADQYVRLLSTHSDHIVLAPDVRAGLLDAVAETIRERGHGTLVLPYVTRLCLARAT